MKLQTSSNLVVEAGLQSRDDYDILLYHHAPLRSFPEYKLVVAQLSPDNLFYNNFGTESKFYYRVNHADRSEIGIGYLIGENRLVRHLPLYYTEGDKMVMAGRPHNFVTADDDYLVVTTYLPHKVAEFLADSNSFITCQKPHLPISISVEPDSIVGRVGDGSLASVSIDHIVDLVLERLKTKKARG